MCLSPSRNTNYRSIAYKKGLTEFNCGHCPECLNARSNEWALRCVYQAKESKKAVMVTLTYDTFQRDKDGKIMTDKNGIPLENLTLRNVDKRDCQLFIKRLREYFDRKKNVQNIKYLLSAEYGKTTGRPHYHAILFGVEFDDLIFHKKSKRGNTIYRSNTLDKLWKNGICTVDSTLITPAVARYCTKYALKDLGFDDTFMLCSQGIGLNGMLKDFNGKSYWIEGREHPIPRIVWQHYIAKKYEKWYNPAKPLRTFTYKYVNMNGNSTYYPRCITYRKDFIWKKYWIENDRYIKKYVPFWFLSLAYKTKPCGNSSQNVLVPHKKAQRLFEKCDFNLYKQAYKAYMDNRKARERFRNIRDNDKVYQSYLQYWKDKSKALENIRGKALNRVYLLDDKKYHNYKVKYLQWTLNNRLGGYIVSPPRKEKTYKKVVPDLVMRYLLKVTCPTPLVLKGQVTGKKQKIGHYIVFSDEVYTDDFSKTPIITKKYEQLSIFPVQTLDGV